MRRRSELPTRTVSAETSPIVVACRPPRNVSAETSLNVIRATVLAPAVRAGVMPAQGAC